MGIVPDSDHAITGHSPALSRPPLSRHGQASGQETAAAGLVQMGGPGGEALSVGGGAEPVVGLETPGEAALVGPADRAFRHYVQAPTFGIEARNIVILTCGSILISLVSQFTAAEIVMHMPRVGA